MTLKLAETKHHKLKAIPKVQQAVAQISSGTYQAFQIYPTMGQLNAHS